MIKIISTHVLHFILDNSEATDNKSKRGVDKLFKSI